MPAVTKKTIKKTDVVPKIRAPHYIISGDQIQLKECKKIVRSDEDLGAVPAVVYKEMGKMKARNSKINRDLDIAQELERLRQKELAREKRNERDRKRRQNKSKEEKDRQRQRRSEKDRANRQKKKEKKENLSTTPRLRPRASTFSTPGPTVPLPPGTQTVATPIAHSSSATSASTAYNLRLVAAPVKPKIVRRRRRYSSNSESGSESEYEDDICFLLFYYSTPEINCIVFSICSSTHTCSSTNHPLHFPNSIPLQ